MARTVGSLIVHEVLAGRFALDGGAMFGVVPRALWAREHPPDARNRIALVSRSLLVETGSRRILVDAGIGTRWSEKERDIYAIDPSVNALTGLEALGFAAEEITDVVITHLHWDHAGGLTRLDEAGEARLAFPRAAHHVQSRNWHWAHMPTDRDRRSYRSVDFELLEASGQVHLLEGATELAPGVELVPSDGHTVGQQLVRLTGDDETWLFCGDLIPTAAHIRPAWGMAFDLYPLTVMDEKEQIVAQAFEEGWGLVLEHDPNVAACTIGERDGQAVVQEILTL